MVVFGVALPATPFFCPRRCRSLRHRHRHHRRHHRRRPRL